MIEFELTYSLLSFRADDTALDFGSWVAAGHPDNPVGATAVLPDAERWDLSSNWRLARPEAAPAQSDEEPCSRDSNCACPECVCCCGDSMHGHSTWDNHSPRSMADYAREQAARLAPPDVYGRIDLLSAQFRTAVREGAGEAELDSMKRDLKFLIRETLQQNSAQSVEQLNRTTEAVYNRLLSSS